MLGLKMIQARNKWLSAKTHFRKNYSLPTTRANNKPRTEVSVFCSSFGTASAGRMWVSEAPNSPPWSPKVPGLFFHRKRSQLSHSLPTSHYPGHVGLPNEFEWVGEPVNCRKYHCLPHVCSRRSNASGPRRDVSVKPAAVAQFRGTPEAEARQD